MERSVIAFARAFEGLQDPVPSQAMTCRACTKDSFTPLDKTVPAFVDHSNDNT